MDIKDIVALIFTFLMVIILQFVGRAKKRAPTPVKAKAVSPKPSKVIARGHNPAPIRSVSKAAAYHEKKVDLKKKMPLFQDKGSLKKAFIMQEVLRRPYE